MAVRMTPADCRHAIAQVIASVRGAGVVHQYRRVIRNEQDARLHLWDGTRINGWMISPAAANTTVTERNPGHAGIGVQGGGNVLTTFQFQIEGYYAIDDANGSERTFGDLAWAVADEFNSYGLLAIPGIAHQLPADVEQFGYAMFAGMYLLHYCRIGVGFRGRTRPYSEAWVEGSGGVRASGTAGLVTTP